MNVFSRDDPLSTKDNPFSFKEFPFHLRTAAELPDFSIGPDHPMAGNNEREWIVRHHCANRPGCTGMSGSCCDAGICSRLPVGDLINLF